jgi:sulfopyruvate decarboxylase subunit alpha
VTDTVAAAGKGGAGRAAPPRLAGVPAEAPVPGSLAAEVLDACRRLGVGLVAGLPDSLLLGVFRALAAAGTPRYVTVTNEGEMPGIAAGAYFAGSRALMIMENSGLRQACEPLARYASTHQVPMVAVMSFRGEFGEPEWWGHSHAQTMVPLLDTLRMPYEIVQRIGDVGETLERAFVHAESGQWPVAVVLGRGCVEEGA